jgi:uncharacterized LabA/DUF88 family protein
MAKLTAQIKLFRLSERRACARARSICDIVIAVDVMRACYLNHAVTVWFFSGDGDFVQLINEVFHAGKCANVWAFLSGVNEEIRYVVDDFLLLDKNFFLSDEEVAAPMSDSAVEPAELTA